MVKGTGDLTVVPDLGTVVDLAERRELAEPMRLRVVAIEICNGVLAHDKRLGVPAIAGDQFMWIMPPEVEEALDPPLIEPYYELIIEN